MNEQGLRFCMLTTFYPPYNFGGDGIAIERLSRSLVRVGHHVTVIHDVDAYRLLESDPVPEPGPSEPNLEVHGLRSGFGALGPILTQQLGRPVLTRRKIRRILAEGNFDVINFHNISLVGGPGLLAEGSGIKLYSAHEHWLVCPTHVLWRHNRETCTGRQCFRCSLKYKRPPQLWRYTGYLERQLHHIDAFIAMSKFSLDKHKEFGFPREMELLPYFLPDAHPDATPKAERMPKPTGEPSPHDRPYFLFVGRLEVIKGLDDVIPIFRQYRNADLLIAGDGVHGRALRALGEGVEGVKFLGRVPQADLRRYYEHALAVIVPSLCFETFGLVLIEAFQQGTPVIARRIGPFPEIVEKVGGELFSNSDELIAAMERLRCDPEKRAMLGRIGYEAFERNWAEGVMVPRYLDLVRGIARRKGNARVLRILGDEAGS